MSEKRIVPVIHNISSIQRLVDSVKTAYALGASEVVITKAYGAAAQHGLAEAGRISYKEGRSIIILPDLRDAVELLRPDNILIVTAEHATSHIDPCNPPRLEGVTLVAFNGGDPDFTRQEAALGSPVYIKGAARRLGIGAEMGILLHALLSGG